MIRKVIMEEESKIKSEIFYLDDNNNIVDEESYTHGIIRETDENGNRVRETYFVRENPEYKGKIVVTEEDVEFLRSMGLDIDERYIVEGKTAITEEEYRRLKSTGVKIDDSYIVIGRKTEKKGIWGWFHRK